MHNYTCMLEISHGKRTLCLVAQSTKLKAHLRCKQGLDTRSKHGLNLTYAKECYRKWRCSLHCNVNSYR